MRLLPFLCLLVGSLAACPSDPPPSAPPATPAGGGQGAAAQPGAAKGPGAGAVAAVPAAVPAGDMAPRRERVGIETGEPATTPPSEAVAAAPAVDEGAKGGGDPTAPSLQEDAGTDRASIVVRWLRETYWKAADGGDREAFLSSLAEDYTAFPSPESKPFNAAPWASESRTPTVGAEGEPAQISRGPITTRVAMHDPEERVSLRWHVAATRGEQCEELDREVDVIRRDGAWRVVVEQELDRQPCRISEIGEVAGVHELLRQAITDFDVGKIEAMIAEGVEVRPFGREGEWVSGAQWADKPEHAWLRKALQGLESEADLTVAAGRQGAVRSADRAWTFVYVFGERIGVQAWRLQRIIRRAP